MVVGRGRDEPTALTLRSAEESCPRRPLVGGERRAALHVTCPDPVPADEADEALGHVGV